MGLTTTRDTIKDAILVIGGQKRIATASPVARSYLTMMACLALLIGAFVFASSDIKPPPLGSYFIRFSGLTVLALLFSVLGQALGRRGLLLASIVALAASWPIAFGMFATDRPVVAVLFRSAWLPLIVANVLYYPVGHIGKHYHTPIVILMVVTMAVAALVAFVPILALTPRDFTVGSISTLTLRGYLLGALAGQYDWLEFGPL